jgi:hypothetical protein
MMSELKYDENGDRVVCISEWCDNPVPRGQAMCFECIETLKQRRESKMVDAPMKALNV